MAESSDKFLLRIFRNDDYNQYISWWSEDGHVPPPSTSLPEAGLVCGKMKAVGFLANTDCDFGVITWWYANPDNKGKESYKALHKLFRGLLEVAQMYGKTKVFCYTNKRAIIRMLESLGFVNHDGHLVAEFN